MLITVLLLVAARGSFGAETLIENFEHYQLNTFPAGKWRWRDSAAQNVYRIEVENGNRFLRAVSKKQGAHIGIEVDSDPLQRRRLRWRWRARTFPKGADERIGEKHDSAAQIQVLFDNRILPRVIKYVWSSAVPAGSRFANPLYVRSYVVVLRNGTTDKPQLWHQEEVNLRDDYRMLFGAEPGKVQAIVILTSSDSTQSHASADYDDIVLLP